MPWFCLRSWTRCRRGLWCALALQTALVSAVAVSSDRDLLRAELSRAQPRIPASR
ncbi:hypothetical protein J5226_10190 [Lysobacter sp. K5869]|uniref:hypothetical protein n=1 Tax=Lysobacter sp. K5869 TaxID=2820808 RepID=UPI001C05F740|nr:hypothetical protein [Lysobacter sp. K5869]QWP78733.1 hypothetical protein J5226_10190 [Lysobacter sp. K5869]